jgi:predicted ABC-type ATPase
VDSLFVRDVSEARGQVDANLAPLGVLIAGPNGSGKSTCAKFLLPEDIHFINADRIAQEISGIPSTSADLRAGRLLLERLSELEDNFADFALETTLATIKLAPRIERLRRSGYEMHLVFLWLPSDELAVRRVLARVHAGGHHVPEETVRRRFANGLKNFFRIYRYIVHTWRIYDNSRVSEPELIAYGSIDGTLTIKQKELWNRLVKEWGS